MTTCAGLSRTLQGKKFDNVTRRGKFMIATIKESDRKLVIHFGMTGSLEYTRFHERSEEAIRYGHLIMRFIDGNALVWTDRRKFGGIYLVSHIADIPLLKEMGPEPLDITTHDFMSLLDRHAAKNIKVFLMDQRDIAGIGNVYSNEILYRSGIAPVRYIDSIGPKERKRLYTQMKKVLKAPICIGPPEGEFGREWLIVHTREMRCPADARHTLVKKKIVGRSAYYCPIHKR
jgi:formamidopyrimidine-DNA glycosylase